MDWFSRLCRDLGLTIHHLVRPTRPRRTAMRRRTIEERRVDPAVTVRRTTIEEIEIRDREPG